MLKLNIFIEFKYPDLLAGKFSVFQQKGDQRIHLEEYGRKMTQQLSSGFISESFPD